MTINSRGHRTRVRTYWRGHPEDEGVHVLECVELLGGWLLLVLYVVYLGDDK